MGRQPPFAELPEELTLSLDDIADLLFVIDMAVEHAKAGSSEHATARRVQRLITSRLWPELGELLDDDDHGGE